MSDEGHDDGPPAGWYPDPDVHGGQRYWDGTRWTEDRRTPGPPASTPPASTPPASTPPGSALPTGTTSAGTWNGGGGWGAASAPAAPIDTWLWQSIVATIFCCQPFGIVAIVYAAMAGSARDTGNLELARHRAGQARMWTLISVGTVLVIILSVVLLGGLGAVLSR